MSKKSAKRTVEATLSLNAALDELIRSGWDGEDFHGFLRCHVAYAVNGGRNVTDGGTWHTANYESEKWIAEHAADIRDSGKVSPGMLKICLSRKRPTASWDMLGDLMTSRCIQLLRALELESEKV